MVRTLGLALFATTSVSRISRRCFTMVRRSSSYLRFPRSPESQGANSVRSGGTGSRMPGGEVSSELTENTYSSDARFSSISHESLLHFGHSTPMSSSSVTSLEPPPCPTILANPDPTPPLDSLVHQTSKSLKRKIHGEDDPSSKRTMIARPYDYTYTVPTPERVDAWLLANAFSRARLVQGVGGWSAAHQACREDRLDILDFIHQHASHLINQRDSHGQSPVSFFRSKLPT